MNRSAIVPSLSAVVFFAAGVVAGQLGTIPASLAAGKPPVRAKAVVASRRLGSAAYRRLFGATSVTESSQGAAYATPGGIPNTNPRILSTKTVVPAGGSRIAGVSPRGPPHG